MKSKTSKAQNQRISSKRQRQKQHLLDVEMRADKERERRVLAGLVFAGKTILIGAAVAALWVGGKECVRRYVWENPRLLLQTPKVQTDGSLTREQVLAAVDIAEGANILSIDLGKTRAILEKMPQVESAEVVRTFPNRVAINITERRPIAWVTAKKTDDPLTSDKALLIDGRGIVLRSRAALPGFAHLPVISGVETENLVPGQRVNTCEMLAAIELVKMTAESARFHVRNIDLEKGSRLVVADQRRATITFRTDNLELQVQRLNQLLDEIEPSEREIKTVNLVPARNIPVTFYPPEPTAPPVVEKPSATFPKPPKPSITPVVEKGTGPTPAPRMQVVEKVKPPKPVKPPAETAPPVRKPSPNQTLQKRFSLDG